MTGGTLPNFSRLRLGQNRQAYIGTFQRPRMWVLNDSRGEEELKKNTNRPERVDEEQMLSAVNDARLLMAVVKLVSGQDGPLRWSVDHQPELLVQVKYCTEILRTIGERARLSYAYFNQMFKVDGPKRVRGSYGRDFPSDQFRMLETLFGLLETNRSLIEVPMVRANPTSTEMKGAMTALNEELLVFLSLGIMIPPQGRVSNNPKENKRAWKYIEEYANLGRMEGENDAMRDYLVSFLGGMSKLHDFDAWMQSNEEWTGLSEQGWRNLVQAGVGWAEKYSWAIIKVAESVVARVRHDMGQEARISYEEQKEVARRHRAERERNRPRDEVGEESESAAKRLKATAARDQNVLPYVPKPAPMYAVEKVRRRYRVEEEQRKSEWEAKNAAPVILSEEERRRRHAQVWGAGGKEDYDLDELARLDREAKNNRGSHAAALAKYEEDQRKSEREAKNNGGPVLSEEERRRRHAQVWGGTKQDNYDWDEYARQQDRLNRATKPSSDESLAHIHPSLAEVKR